MPPGATTGNTNQRRRLILQNPVQGQFYGTIGHVDDTGRGIYHGLLLSAQRRLKNNLSVLTNYTLSKCMSDPATTEITGPTIVDPNNPDLDYSYCSSDRRHVFNVSAVVRVGEVGSGVVKAVFSDWQFSPLVRWQSGNRSSITTGVDNALTGMGGQRAVQILDDPYGDGTPGNYLNRAAFTSPAAGTYSTLAPFSIVNPSRLQNDLAVTRTFKVGASAEPAVPLGDLQRDQQGELQRAGDGAQQRELRPDPERRRSAHHAVRAEGRLLIAMTISRIARRAGRRLRLSPQPSSAPRHNWAARRPGSGRDEVLDARSDQHGNVKSLQRAWTFHTGDKTGFFESTPLVVDGTMYVSAQNGVFALDPLTGAQLWKFETDGAHAARRGVLAGRRQVAGAHPRLVADERLLALDAKTGRLVQEFGQGGFVDMGTTMASPRVDLQGRADHAGRRRR